MEREEKEVLGIIFIVIDCWILFLVFIDSFVLIEFTMVVFGFSKLVFYFICSSMFFMYRGFFEILIYIRIS